ncbi:MAG: hypothetical protein P1U37_16910 [Minwuia sp.]|nr:hypothetical protein [Minwuia sp.]
MASRVGQTLAVKVESLWRDAIVALHETCRRLIGIVDHASARCDVQLLPVDA